MYALLGKYVSNRKVMTGLGMHKGCVEKRNDADGSCIGKESTAKLIDVQALSQATQLDRQ
jgi:hypothetical protein